MNKIKYGICVLLILGFICGCKRNSNLPQLVDNPVSSSNSTEKETSSIHASETTVPVASSQSGEVTFTTGSIGNWASKDQNTSSSTNSPTTKSSTFSQTGSSTEKSTIRTGESSTGYSVIHDDNSWSVLV